MKKIVLATGNRNKVIEFREILAGTGLVFSPQSEFNVEDVPETGLTFVENAIIKARHAAKITGLPALADDSGLEVAALNGRPGIYSARYAEGSHEARYEKVLAEMQGVPSEQRQARFVCVLVLMRHAEDPTPIIAEGFCEGIISEKPYGEKGFGYDPILYLPEFNCTCAELAAEEKHKLSHRGNALRELLVQLNQL